MIHFFRNQQVSVLKKSKLSETNIWNNIFQARIDAGVIAGDEEVSIKNHLARHAFNNRLKNNGVEQFDREEYIGHAHSLDVNMIYTHKSDKQEKRIARIAEKYCQYLTKNIPDFRDCIIKNKEK